MTEVQLVAAELVPDACGVLCGSAVASSEADDVWGDSRVAV